jgi:peptidoglycan/xylan/chitin deacetylase (PgdA/CDA1 family)
MEAGKRALIGPLLFALTVAVTFDDLPATGGERGSAVDVLAINRAIVGTLAGRNIPAVGFVNEGGLETNGQVDPALVSSLTLWLDAGLELGNHTYSHPSLHRVSKDLWFEDVLKGERVTRPLVAAHGGIWRWFRHPFLQTGRDLTTKHEAEAFLAEHGYRVAPVTIDNGEWIFAKAYANAGAKHDRRAQKKLANAYVAYMESKTDYWERSARALFDRDIPQVLLVHANRLNADQFERIAAMLASRGYRFVTLDAAVSDPAYLSPDTFTGAGGISWIHRWALTKGGPTAVLTNEPEVPAWVMRAAGVTSE